MSPPAAPPDVPARRRPHALVPAAAVVAVFALVGATVLLARRDPSPPRVEAAPAAERPTSAAARRLAELRVDPFDPLAAPAEIEGTFRARLDPPPPYDAVDSTLIDAGDRRYRLVEAIAVGRSEVCRRRDGALFACGLQGRAALQNFLAGKRMVCDPLFVDVDRRSEVVPARCRADGRDLAERMIEAGLAHPSPLAGPRLVAAMERAKKDGRGVWSGTPTVPARDPALDDDRAIAFGSARFGAAEPPAAAQP